MMGNVCGRLNRVKIHGNESGTSTQDVRKFGLNLKQTVAGGLKGQSGMNMRILRRV
jgi:hypothetical protein